MKKNLIKYIGALVVLLVIFAGSVLYSKNSMPDNALYFLKLDVYEKITGLSNAGAYSKAKYALELADKRLQELEYLKGKNLVPSKYSDIARDDFNQKTVLAQQHILEILREEKTPSRSTLELMEILDVEIEQAKEIFNIDQLEKLPEDAPLPKATSTKK